MVLNVDDRGGLLEDVDERSVGLLRISRLAVPFSSHPFPSLLSLFPSFSPLQVVLDLLAGGRAVREGGQQSGALGDPRGRGRLPGGADALREVGGVRREGLRARGAVTAPSTRAIFAITKLHVP